MGRTQPGAAVVAGPIDGVSVQKNEGKDKALRPMGAKNVTEH